MTLTCPESYPAKVGGTTDAKEKVMLHGSQEMANLLDDQLQFPEIVQLSLLSCNSVHLNVNPDFCYSPHNTNLSIWFFKSL